MGAPILRFGSCARRLMSTGPAPLRAPFPRPRAHAEPPGVAVPPGPTANPPQRRVAGRKRVFPRQLRARPFPAERCVWMTSFDFPGTRGWGGSARLLCQTWAVTTATPSCGGDRRHLVAQTAVTAAAERGPSHSWASPPGFARQAEPGRGHRQAHGVTRCPGTPSPTRGCRHPHGDALTHTPAPAPHGAADGAPCCVCGGLAAKQGRGRGPNPGLCIQGQVLGGVMAGGGGEQLPGGTAGS